MLGMSQRLNWRFRAMDLGTITRAYTVDRRLLCFLTLGNRGPKSASLPRFTKSESKRELSHIACSFVDNRGYLRFQSS